MDASAGNNLYAQSLHFKVPRGCAPTRVSGREHVTVRAPHVRLGLGWDGRPHVERGRQPAYGPPAPAGAPSSTLHPSHACCKGLEGLLIGLFRFPCRRQAPPLHVPHVPRYTQDQARCKAGGLKNNFVFPAGGKRYFTCPKGYGGFVRPDKVKVSRISVILSTRCIIAVCHSATLQREACSDGPVLRLVL